ncbi:MAG: DUF2357 domain-containing protein [Vicinamibacterales bacterium]
MSISAPWHVFWRAEGEAGRIALWPAPHPNTGFTEAQRFSFEKPGQGLVLRVDDEPLPDDATGLAWTWRPGFYAGQVRAELLQHGRRLESFVLDVSPDARKLGGPAFQTMVRELWSMDPALVLGQEPATAQSGSLGRLEDPLVEFERLRRYTPEYLSALASIAANPRRALRAVRALVPLNQTRAVDRQTALSASRSGVSVLFASEDGHAGAVDASTRLDVPVVEESLDAAANRAMKSLTVSVLQRVRAVAVRLQGRVDNEQASDTRTGLATRWPARRQFLLETEARLQRALRQPPFPSVRRAEVSAAGLNAVSADPLYARAWGRGWRAIRHGVEGDVTDERFWISPSWELYERWCFMKLGSLLEQHTPGWTWRRRDGSRRTTGAGHGGRAELWLQPTFRTSEIQRAGRWSVSKQRIPDIVFRLSDGKSERFVVLDAKYRARREHVLDAMQSAHIYQDALRIGGRRPEASLLLVPAGGHAAWLESGAFQEKHRVGVHVLSPGRACELPAVIKGLLTTAG